MSGTLQQRFTKLAERIDAMTPRERGLIFFSTLTLLFFLTNSLVLTPINKNNQQLEQMLHTRLGQLKTLEDKTQIALDADKTDVDAEQKMRLKTLREQLAQHDPTRPGTNSSLVQPTEMVALVEQILSRNHALQVIHIENLPPELLDKPATGSTAPANTSASGVFRHGMQIELRGRYIDIVNYLRELETLPWKIYWGRFALNAEEYPNSRMTLVIYTLSLRPGWMGT
ncbi:MAG: hypothetical protein HY273_07375 [Gammaproteobacteria bacterium]|nr:hypothetical protein [Gammaproteobacteria bacterium]